MIMQENDFLRAYNDTDELWDTPADELTTDDGKPVVFVRDFQSPEQLMNNLPKRTSGIYLIRYNCPENGPQYYVGKSVDIKHRTHVHFDLCPLRDSRLLHEIIRKHYKSNPERFSIAVLAENIPGDNLSDLEIEWVEKLHTFFYSNRTRGLNLTYGGDGGGHPKVTVEIYNKIVAELQRPKDDPEWKTQTEIADIYLASTKDDGSKTDVDKTVILINHGEYFLSTGDLEYPIRSAEFNKEVKLDTLANNWETAKATKAFPHIVCLDRNNNYYYFPNTTKAAEFAAMNGFYSNEARAREKIKLRVISAEDLDDFKNKSKNAFIGPGAQRQLYWGILKAVPNMKDTVFGGFSGEVIKNSQGKELGCKF
jgi:hypothetical protein